MGINPVLDRNQSVNKNKDAIYIFVHFRFLSKPEIVKKASN